MDKELILIDSHIKMEAGLLKIKEWADAYPLTVFPEPDMKKAHAVLKENGMTLDAISASNFRFILEKLRCIVEEALADT